MRRFNFEQTLRKIRTWIDRTSMYLEAMFNALRRAMRYTRALRELSGNGYMIQEEAEETLRQGRWEALPWIERGKADKNPEIRHRSEYLYAEIYQSQGHSELEKALLNYRILFLHPDEYTRDQQQAAADFFRKAWGYTVEQGTRKELLKLIKMKFDEWEAAIPVPMPRKYLCVVEGIRSRIADILIFREEPTPEPAPAPGIPAEEAPEIEGVEVPLRPPAPVGEGEGR